MARRKKSQSKLDLSYLQSPTVRRKRIAGIRRAARLRRKLKRMQSQSLPDTNHLREASRQDAMMLDHRTLLSSGDGEPTTGVSWDSKVGRLNVQVARILIRQANDLLSAIED